MAGSPPPPALPRAIRARDHPCLRRYRWANVLSIAGSRRRGSTVSTRRHRQHTRSTLQVVQLPHAKLSGREASASIVGSSVCARAGVTIGETRFERPQDYKPSPHPDSWHASSDACTLGRAKRQYNLSEGGLRKHTEQADREACSPSYEETPGQEVEGGQAIDDHGLDLAGRRSNFQLRTGYPGR